MKCHFSPSFARFWVPGKECCATSPLTERSQSGAALLLARTLRYEWMETDARASLRDLEVLNRTSTAAPIVPELSRPATSACEQLATRVAALPPSAVVSKAALAAFKQQHLEMMKHSRDGQA